MSQTEGQNPYKSLKSQLALSLKEKPDCSLLSLSSLICVQSTLTFLMLAVLVLTWGFTLLFSFWNLFCHCMSITFFILCKYLLKYVPKHVRAHTHTHIHEHKSKCYVVWDQIYKQSTNFAALTHFQLFYSSYFIMYLRGSIFNISLGCFDFHYNIEYLYSISRI